ncbi:inositol monophosphatase [Marinomonas sp. C2222]|uniref:Inositol-1-monophosphatase n=1 Tax=Marinomonas sargassi TaxID=2984494 RepID=A0ABT2YU94_9GAMM|nr:inositol monophosphatase family protein [Marinomonas sargassi]MCV2403470.1 inositol monophosphatase [Marinomonas sargassi]
MTVDQHEWLAFAKSIALKAGDMIVAFREENAFQKDYKLGHELVTSADLAVDQLLVSSLAEKYPTHGIMSEESFPNLDLGSQDENVPVWVIDPIDGTVNFAHGHKHVAVSIGLYLGGERILGVVNAPFLGECFWALRGQGAYCNDAKLSVSGAIDLRNALVATGFPYVKKDIATILARVSNVLHACQDIRRNGSAALDLCWVAAGRLDAYFESVKPWDMAAGALIAEEAGAYVGHYASTQNEWPEVVDGESLLVSTPELCEKLCVLLK